MKNSHIYILIIFILISININYSFAEINNCNNKNGYDLYKCREKYICGQKYGPELKKSDNNQSSKQINIVILTKPYNKKISGDGLTEAKKIYRENQNNIYKCGILKVQIDSLKYIKKKLVSVSLKKKIEQRIKKRIDNLKKKSTKIGCINTTTTTLQNKFNILNQSTYELCNYNSYLEYLKEYDSNIDNVLFTKNNNSTITKNKQYSIKEVANIMTNIQSNINNEVNHSYKIFPLAYNAYSQYENNYTIHVLLDLIREDYIVLRNKLYSALNPISQFVYKIANAMKMP